MLKIAETIARNVHSGQKRMITHEEYIKHVERVANSLPTHKLQAIGWLHDVLEENPKMMCETLIRHGIPKDMVEAVWTLTRKEENYFEYIIKIGKHENARIVKIADLKDNLKDLPKGSLRDKYLLSVYILEKMTTPLEIETL